MAKFNKTDRKALRILSDAVSRKLGPSDKVTREIQRAQTSGKQIDRFMARAAFDALPGPRRSEIGSTAENLAHAIIREEIGEWAPFSIKQNFQEMDMPQGKARRTRNPAPGENVQSPPHFLSRTPR